MGGPAGRREDPEIDTRGTAEGPYRPTIRLRLSPPSLLYEDPAAVRMLRLWYRYVRGSSKLPSETLAIEVKDRPGWRIGITDGTAYGVADGVDASRHGVDLSPPMVELMAEDNICLREFFTLAPSASESA